MQKAFYFIFFHFLKFLFSFKIRLLAALSFSHSSQICVDIRSETANPLIEQW